MANIRSPGEQWNEATFFVEADARSAADARGLRILLHAVRLFPAGLDVCWGAGDIEPRFFVRLRGASSGELLSGWASGSVAVQVAVLRDLLKRRSHVLARLTETVGLPLQHDEPGFDAAELLRSPAVEAVVATLAALADSIHADARPAGLNAISGRDVVDVPSRRADNDEGSVDCEPIKILPDRVHRDS